MTQDTITISPGSRFRAAMVLAIIADALQIVVFPLFVEGALSPADDVLDLGIAALLVNLLGWHWEFLPSFLAKLVPGVDLVPFWTMAVANVYRKSKQIAVAEEKGRQQHPRARRPTPFPKLVNGMTLDGVLVPMFPLRDRRKTPSSASAEPLPTNLTLGGMHGEFDLPHTLCGNVLSVGRIAS